MYSMGKKLGILALIGCLAVSTACMTRSSNYAVNPNSPDEFRVITKPPLTIPPEFNLRPPAVGTTQPSEVVQARETRNRVFGTDNFAFGASASERALVLAAGANAVSPYIRSIVDFQEAGVIRRSDRLTDRIIQWWGSEDQIQEAAQDSATAGGEVEINRVDKRKRLKLPGT